MENNQSHSELLKLSKIECVEINKGFLRTFYLLKEYLGIPTAEVARKIGMTPSVFFQCSAGYRKVKTVEKRALLQITPDIISDAAKELMGVIDER